MSSFSSLPSRLYSVLEQISLRDQYIMGKIDRDTYNQQYQELKDSGLQQIIDEAAQAYKLITE